MDGHRRKIAYFGGPISGMQAEVLEKAPRMFSVDELWARQQAFERTEAEAAILGKVSLGDSGTQGLEVPVGVL
jgi:hypothetical protein